MQGRPEERTGGPSRSQDADGSDEMALMEAALMGSPQAAVGGPRRRKRTKYNPWQKSLLEKAYSVCKYPNVWTREVLSKALNVDDARIIVWFQNRRARYRRRGSGVHPESQPPLAPTLASPPPTGTLHYPAPTLPLPAGMPRRPLAEVGLGTNGEPSEAAGTLWRGVKVELPSPGCGAGTSAGPDPNAMWRHWAPPQAFPATEATSLYPVDEIDVDFTLADFNIDLGLDFSHAL